MAPSSSGFINLYTQNPYTLVYCPLPRFLLLTIQAYVGSTYAVNENDTDGRTPM